MDKARDRDPGSHGQQCGSDPEHVLSEDVSDVTAPNVPSPGRFSMAAAAPGDSQLGAKAQSRALTVHRPLGVMVASPALPPTVPGVPGVGSLCAAFVCV